LPLSAFTFLLSPLTFSLSAPKAVTLHDFLSSIRTFVVLCRRELYFKNLAVLNFLTVLPRCRSGCKDAIILIACQVLFSLISAYFFISESLKKRRLFLKRSQMYRDFSRLPKDFYKNLNQLYNCL
jgi:hypothetical protein